MPTPSWSRPASAKSHGPRLAVAQQAARKRAPDPSTGRGQERCLAGFPGRSLSVSPR
jgi:hypothetical protein